MLTRFKSHLKKYSAFAQLSIQSQLEYRMNFLTDAFAQPILTALLEIVIWSAVFAGSGKDLIAGFAQNSYMAYAIWAPFIARLSANWYYEYKMIESVEKGEINSLLVRPFSFYEAFLAQFMGYKFLIATVSILIPISLSWIFNLPLYLKYVPFVMLQMFFYLILIHTLGFCISCLAFHWNRVHSMSMAKNLALWMFTGELFPLDMMPDKFKDIMLNLPFAHAVYMPIGLLTGRLEFAFVLQKSIYLLFGILIFALLAQVLWRQGVRQYTGTGA